MKILNFLQIDDFLATSGQPLENEFVCIADLGYEAVINLALPSADNAVATEGSLVTGLGMKYFHIPVVWESPMEEQFRLFVTLMEYYQAKKIWVHCALNMRVSCFIYLYRTLYLGISKDLAQQSIDFIWQPNEVWSDFMSLIEVKSQH